MNNFIKNMSNTTYSENNALMYKSSLSSLVDMFFKLPAMRKNTKEEIANVILPAFKEDPILASCILLYTRDIREGAGERSIFKTSLSILHDNNYKDIIYKIIKAIPEIGRCDDLFCLWDNYTDNVFEVIALELSKHNQLMAKWLPRRGNLAKQLTKKLKLKPKEYRRLLVTLTNVVETKMCNKEWKNIEYSRVPSKAMTIYSRAFKRHDLDRFNKYIEDVDNNKQKINTSSIYPYEIIKMSDNSTKDTLWNNLPDYISSDNTFLPIIDVSASMNSSIHEKNSIRCVDIAISLGIYCAERNKSVFKNHFITFSEIPEFCKIEGNTISTKVNCLKRSKWGYNTNLFKVFKLIVSVIQSNNIPKEDIPNNLIIFSDMEFDAGSGEFPLDQINDMFNSINMVRPNIIWWNIQSRSSVTPATINNEGTALVSGFSPVIMKSVLNSKLDSIAIMKSIVEIDRYLKYFT